VTPGFVIRDERLICEMIFYKSVGLLPCPLNKGRGETITDMQSSRARRGTNSVSKSATAHEPGSEPGEGYGW